VTNIQFETADVYTLPFPDASFDAVFGHQLLLWLKEPLAALIEARRVLRAGGLAAMRTIDPTVCAIDPSTPLLARLPGLLPQVWARMGADWSVGHQQRRLLLEAGFARSENHAGIIGGGTPEFDRFVAERGFLIFERSLGQPDVRAAAIQSGLADEAVLDGMLADLQSLHARPDAFVAVLQCSALG
jgi:SAM-dependent methyltransferase